MREIRLGGRPVAFVLRRSARRSFALQVNQRGVKVAVPMQAGESEIEAFIHAHQDWLLERIAEHESRAAARPFAIVDGAELPVLGEICRIRIGAGGRSPFWRLGADGVEELVLPRLPDAASHVVKALRRRALPWFTERVAEYCFRLGRPRPDVRLSSARTRWGSCSSRSGIRLHWRLAHLPPGLIDYVVAHEVAHLVEMNHSPRFWAVVENLYPQWREARNRLRAIGRELPLLVPGAGQECMDED